MAASNGRVFETNEFEKNPSIESDLENEAHFKEIDFLGRGAFGSVSSVKHLQKHKKLFFPFSNILLGYNF